MKLDPNKLRHDPSVIDITGTVDSAQRHRLLRAKAAYTTRRVALDAMASLASDAEPPSSGDLVLARVTKLGRHEHLELTTGRRSSLFLGDEVLVCYGNRYAPDQFEAVVPTKLEACHLVAAGGIAASALSWHNSISGPTCIEPLGYAADALGKRLNLRDWALPPLAAHGPRPFTVAVLGTSMNAGKTTTAAHLIKGAARARVRVASAKITGTGAGGDAWLMADAGAHPVLDFTDAGLASTYLAPLPELERVMKELVRQLTATGAELIILEVADGLYQQETSALVNSATFANTVDGVVFAATDAMGAAAGAQWLQTRRVPVLGITGTLTRSPLASQEAGQATGLPIFKLSQLSDPSVVLSLMQRETENTLLAQAQ